MGKRSVFICVLMVLILAANSHEDVTREPCNDAIEEVRKEELGKFQGKWVMTGLVADGSRAEPESVKHIDVTILIRDNKCVIITADFGTSGEVPIQDITVPVPANKVFLQFDSSRKPCTLDFLEFWPERRLYGFYRIEGDIWQIAFHSDKRPTNFISKGHDGGLIMTLRRIKE